MYASAGFLILLAACLPSPAFAQQKAAPAKARPAAKKAVKHAAPPAAPAHPEEPQVMTNETVVRLVRSGMAEADLIGVIEASPAKFQMDGDHLVQLNEQKVPGAVIRAMLNKKGPPEPAPAAAPASEPPVAAAPPAPAPLPANLDQPLVRQGAGSFPLADRPQKVMFVKSQSSNAKEAIADLLLSDVGLSLITMGLAPQMKMWNPYFGDTLQKATALGKGLLRSKGSDTKGFEYDMLPGTTADVTLREGRPELLIPMNKYLASADVDLASVQPVLLKLESREKDQARLLSARQVTLKETKKGRFDFKPTVDRQELDLEQHAIPVEVELTADHVYRVTPKEDLGPGEYALVFRRKAESGAFTADLPLKPSPAAAPEQAATMPFGMMTPAAQPPARRSLLGMGRPAPPPATAQDPRAPVAGFLAFDFRVLK
jgi:hypothetical protein